MNEQAELSYQMEIDRLRHDIERMQEIDSEHLAEIDRLRAEKAEMREALKDALFALDGLSDGDFVPGGSASLGAMDRTRHILAKTAKEEK